MTLWDAYVLLLSRLGLARRETPAVEEGALELSMPALNPAELFKGGAWAAALLPASLGLALLGQWSLFKFGSQPLPGVVLLGLGAALFVFAAARRQVGVREMAVSAGADSSPESVAGIITGGIVSVRWGSAVAALILSGLTFLSVGGNNFSLFGRLSWIASLGAWLVAFWEGPVTVTLDWRRWRERLLRREWTLRFSRDTVLIMTALALSAAFRFAYLDDVPAAMTSDHVEKLIDVNGILNKGLRPIFEPSNGGREPMEFYLAAITARFAGTGLTHLTLKLVTSLAGFATLPIIYLLAREALEQKSAALLAMLAAGIGWWPNVISRNGLRFPFAPLFAALSLWLIVRALNRNRRNEALLAGLALGIGLYGYTPIRIVPLAVALALALYGLHRRGRRAALTMAGWLAMMGLVALAAFTPMIRYAADEPQNFWRRTFTRIGGDPELPAQPSWQVFLENEWNSVRMFSWTSDSAWLVSPAGQPALDWIMGASFAVGVAFLLYRYARRRHWFDLFAVVSIPILLLPSTLALAFPIENPSLHRSGAAVPLVFLIAAVPLALLIESAQKLAEGWRKYAAGLGLAAALLAASAQINWHIVFVKYADQYKSSVQNAPEIGMVVRAWAESIGSWDTVVVRAYPFWVDTRAVGIYAGRFGWDNAILQPEQLDDLAGDPRPKLYILNRYDAESISTLRLIYPQGKLAYHISDYYDKDFLTYFVPGAVDFDERTLAP